jgi:flagellar motor switch protein FliN
MPAGSTQTKLFCKMWADNIAASLASRSVGAPVVIAGEPVPTPAPTQQEFEKLVCIRFTCAGEAKGEFLWVAEKPAAKQIAKLFTGAAPDVSPELSEQESAAFAEFLRQVAARTATSWKAEAGAEIEFVYQTTAEPASVTAHCVTLTLTGQQFPEISLRLFLDAELHEALGALPAPPEPKQQPAAANPSPVSPAPPADTTPPPRTGPLPANLGLVLDVALEATIRFGEREMLLRDIFGLMPGAVVELNQMVNEPAELRVAGRLVARGEVVVVDGNFGLRVTEVATLSERVAAAAIQL